jgi:hypothetical protein
MIKGHTMVWINSLYEHYGFLVLFYGLLVESIALPFPGELAMAIGLALEQCLHILLAGSWVRLFLHSMASYCF